MRSNLSNEALQRLLIKFSYHLNFYLKILAINVNKYFLWLDEILKFIQKNFSEN